jgi:hypothetical protein
LQWALSPHPRRATRLAIFDVEIASGGGDLKITNPVA